MQPYYAIEGKASGDLVGKGRWEFSEENGWTTVSYFWNVETTRIWMNLTSPILKPFFKWNHNLIMKWGAIGIGKRLDCRVDF